MKKLIIGIVVALILAFAAHAAYNNLTAGDKQKSTAAKAAQPPSTATVANQQELASAPVIEEETVEPVLLKTADMPSLAAATPRVTTRLVTPNQPAATTTQKPAPVAATNTTATVTPAQRTAQQAPALTKVNNNIATQKTTSPENQIDTPNTISEYDFAFVAPEALQLNDVSGATELALQNITEEPVLSPSAPRQ